MNNMQPGVMDLLLRAHFASIQLEAERQRLADAARPDRPAREAARPTTTGVMRAARALRSLGARAVPALGR